MRSRIWWAVFGTAAVTLGVLHLERPELEEEKTISFSAEDGVNLPRTGFLEAQAEGIWRGVNLPSYAPPARFGEKGEWIRPELAIAPTTAGEARKRAEFDFEDHRRERLERGQ